MEHGHQLHCQVWIGHARSNFQSRITKIYPKPPPFSCTGLHSILSAIVCSKQVGQLIRWSTCKFNVNRRPTLFFLNVNLSLDDVANMMSRPKHKHDGEAIGAHHLIDGFQLTLVSSGNVQMH